MRLILVLCWLGCGATSVPPVQAEAVPDAVPARASVEAIETWLETARLASTEVALSAVTPPPSFRERVGDGLTTWTSEDGLWVVVRYNHQAYVVARAYADSPPAGLRPRLVPVLHGGRWPHFALLVEGWDIAVPLSDVGVQSWRVPLRAAGGGSLDETARLSHVTDWDDEESGGVMVYGAPEALVAVDDRDIPSGYTVDRIEYHEVDPDDPLWREPIGGQYGVDERLLAQEAPANEGTLTRIRLKLGDQLHTAFRLADRSELDEYSFTEGVVLPVDGRILVHFTVQGWQQYFSLHDAETGERIGEPQAVGIHGGDFHGDPPSIKPILRDGQIEGYVLFLGGALVFEELGEPGHYTPICEESPRPPRARPEDDDWEEPPYLSRSVFRLATVRGVRCLMEEPFDP